MLEKIKSWFSGLSTINKVLAVAITVILFVALFEGKSKTGGSNFVDNIYSKERDQVIGKDIVLLGYARVNIVGMDKPGGNKSVHNIPTGNNVIVIKDHFDKNSNKLYYQVIDARSPESGPAWTEYSDIINFVKYDIITQANFKHNKIVMSKPDKQNKEGELLTAPGDKGLAIRTVKSGERFLILDAINSTASGGWYQVRSLETGGIGWLNVQNLSF